MSLPLVLKCGPLEISFVRQQDRIAHAVRFHDQSLPFMQSAEGSDQDDWPASPALRDLHLESRPDGRQVILLVGMAGTSHWSASFEIDSAKATIVADIACRVHQPPSALGSNYSAAAGVWSVTKQVAVAKNTDCTAMAVLSVETAGSELHSSPSGLRISPTLTCDQSAYPRTIQWHYRLTGWPAGEE